MPFGRPVRPVLVALTLAALAAGCAKPASQLTAGLTGPGAGGGYGAGGYGAGGGAGLGGQAPGSSAEFTVGVGDRVFFAEDQSTLSTEARATLDRQAQWLAQYGRYVFVIEGHADERGTREYNLALGARRAEAVRDYLAARGVAVARMRTVSYGKERPVAECEAANCWSQNRRSVTVLSAAGV